MDIQRERQKMELIGRLLILPDGERDHFLNGITDESLRRELAQLVTISLGKLTINISTPCQGLLERPLSLCPELKPGDSFGPWHLTSILGHGGMNTVYAARHRHSKESVALKVVNGLENSRLCLEKERRILKGLRLANVVALLEAGETDGRFWVALQQIKGSTLDVWLKQHHPNFDSRLTLFKKLCHAVQQIHYANLIHRDLKPGNIMVSQTCEPIIIDFGASGPVVASEQYLATGLTHRIFTPKYASPEQRDGTPSTPQTDTYALGLLLYFILTGKDLVPSAQKNQPTGIGALDAKRQGHIGELKNPQLRHIIEKAICVDPSLRFKHPHQLLKAINQLRLSPQSVANRSKN